MKTHEKTTTTTVPTYNTDRPYTRCYFCCCCGGGGSSSLCCPFCLHIRTPSLVVDTITVRVLTNDTSYTISGVNESGRYKVCTSRCCCGREAS